MSVARDSITALSREQKSALLARLMRERAARKKTAPLSFAQQRLWFLDQLEPGNSAYNVAVAFSLHGHFSPAAFDASLREVVRRHETLRTTFTTVKDTPVQEIAAGMEIPVCLVDLSRLPEKERQGAGERIAAESRQVVFDLARGPLLNLILFRQTRDHLVVHLVMHHIISDGWSVGILARELSALYRAYRGMAAPPLARLPFQYSDYARAQRQWLSAAVLESRLAYWRERLAGAPALELPTDRPRPPVRSPRGAAQSFAFPPALGAALLAFCKREKSTLFMALVSAFHALLSRYTGQTDISLGIPVDGRNRQELEGLIGFFVNTLVLRADLSGDPSFADLARQVRETALDAYQHQDVPFDKLVAQLQPERDLSRTPLFQAMVAMQSLGGVGNDPAPAPEGSELRIGGAKFDLTLNVVEGAERIHGTLEYSRDLFDAPTIRRMLGHLRALVGDAVEAPDKRVGALEILSDSERHQILVEWNAAEARFARLAGERTFDGLFVAQVERSRAAMAAAEQGGRRLTYGELDARVEALARALLVWRVEPENVVALLAERGLDLLTAILAVFRVGAAYLPLDPRHPGQRQRELLEQSGAALVLTSEALAGDLEEALAELRTEERPAVLRLERLLAMPESVGAGPEPAAGAPRAARRAREQLAYVIYTSGSTGAPKGAMVEQRGMLNHLEAKIADLHLGPDDVVAQTASQCFDVSVWQFLAALLVGGRVLILGDEISHDPQRLLAAASEAGVTVLETVPSMLRGMLDACELEPAPGGSALPSPAGWRWLVVTGETFTAELARRWLKLFPRVPLLNAYGPTECSDDVTHQAVFQAPAGQALRIPVGRPLANLELYVLDRRFREVPIGVAGELCVSGVGVGRGYLGRADQTAERFVPSAFGELPGERLYRTGDLARFLPGGEVDLIGRIDQQVKVRGVRIEPGEIEAAVGRHPEVREVAVVVRQEPQGARLVAWIVPRGEGLDPGDLKVFARSVLPEAMVPAAFALVERLPLLASGKVDRKSLAAQEPPAGSGALPEARRAPQSRTEEILAGIWKEVLRVEEVGSEDNFFDLGGESILALQVVSRARRAGLHLLVRHLFEHPTVAELATAIAVITGVAGVSGEAAVAAVSWETATVARAAAGPVPLTPIQRWLLDRDLPSPEHFNLALLLEVGAPLEPAPLARAVDLLVAHHDALRLRFAPPIPERPGWQQSCGAAAGPSPFAQLDLAALPEERQAPAIEAAAAALQGSLSLTAGPLLRVALLRPGADRADRLLIAIHHLAVDGVSWRILLDDLESLYGQLCRGEDGVLPAPTLPFALWAERLAAHGRAPSVLAEAGYWRERLGSPAPRLPVDHARGENLVRSARTVVFALGAEETRALVQEASRAYHTQINDLLLTALVESFAGWTGSRRLRLDLEGHGREEIGGDLDVSRTVGWFTALYPVLLDLGAETQPGGALKAVKEQLRAIPNRGIGYDLLRYGEGEVGEALRSLPAPEVLFNYLGQLDQAVASDSLFRMARESPGPANASGQPRSHLLEVVASVSGGRLRVSYIYSESVHRRSTIEALGESFRSALARLIAHCVAPGVGGFTPSDFPLAEVDQLTLDRLAAAGEIEDLYPAVPMQKGMLFHSLHSPDAGAYVQQISLALGRELNVPAFERAWGELVARHAVLRTSFAWLDLATPLQVVRREGHLSWQRLDWRELSLTEQRQRLAVHLKEDRRQGFDLFSAPPLRFCRIDLGAAGHRFVWTFHHALLDGWSLPILLRELFVLYRAASENAAAHLDPAPAYREYVAWLSRQEVSAAEAFWRRELAGFTAPTALGAERAKAITRPASGRLRPVRDRVVHPATTAGLRSLVRQHRLTLNTLVQAAWALLLARYSSTEDVVFGAVTSGRSAPLAGIESMVGLAINTLPARVRVAPQAALPAWLAALQEQQVAARQFEHTPLSQVQSWSEVPRDLPLFDSILVFENYPVDDSVRRQAGTNLGIGEAEFFEQTNYLLTLIVSSEANLGMRMLYDLARFDAPDVTRILQHMEVLLAGMVAHADRPLGALPLLDRSESHQILVEWNATAGRFAGPELLHEGVAAQAARAPDAVAVVLDEQELTYAALVERAGRLARRLEGLGVGPGVPVGICAERSLELVIGLLAILEAGGAYVPLDPSYPRERLALMLEDVAGGREGLVLLLQQGLASRLGALPRGATVVALDAAGEEASAASRAGRIEPFPDDLAYVIFTSGSTGRPKGAMNTHRAIRNKLLWMQETYGLTAGDRVLQKTPVSFDVSVWELFWPLLAGAQLVLARPEGHRDSAYLVELIERQGITTVHFVPSLLRAFLEEPDLGRCGSLVRVMASGEALTRDLVDRFHAEMAAVGPGVDGIALHNLYGPTEAAVEVTFRSCPAGESGPVPIGRPITNLEIHLLDSSGREVPVGVSGELHIGGMGLARGYLGRPDLTAERFVPHLAPQRPGERLYRTGDLARWLPAGEVGYLGRIDHQVKVRGVRIELREIEAVLGEHPAVREAAVVLRQEPQGARLVAWIAPYAGEIDRAGLRDFVQSRLPEVMVPAVFVAVAQLPLQPNGKVDRKALAREEIPSLESGFARTARRQPRNRSEEILAGIWKDVLRVEEVGVEDNFFALGGESILALQVVSRARRAGLHLLARHLFEHPTVAELAAVAETSSGEPAAALRESAGPVPLTPIQRWFLEQDLPRPWHFNQALLLAVGAPLAAAPLARAVDLLVAHHDALRLRFAPPTPERPVWQQSCGAVEGPSPFAQLDLAALPEERQAPAIEAAAAALQGSLSLTAGPLLRVALLRPGADRADRLLIVGHHLVVDGVSWRILLDDLESLYGQLCRGEDGVLPAPTLPFALWAERLSAHGGSPSVLAEAGYWRERLGSPAPRLPVDHAAGANLVRSARTVVFALGAEETRALIQEASRAYHTQINDLLLTALVESFADWTGSRRLRLDLEGHGREEIGEDLDVSRTVGWFTALYPVLLDLGGETQPGGALKAVKEQLRAIPNRGIGYGLLRHGEGEAGEALRSLPTSEVLFNYLGQLDQAVASDSLFRMARESAGPARASDQPRSHLLEVVASVSGGRLRVSYAYSEAVHRRSTIEGLGQSFLSALARLIAHCVAPGVGGFTPSDFPLAEVDQRTLDRLAAEGEIEDLYPASPVQQGMLFHSLHSPDSGVYVEQISLALGRELNVPAFEQAWGELVARHAVLRTAFAWRNRESLLQVVYARWVLPWRRLDWRSLPEAGQRRELAAFLAEDRQQGVDLFSTPPLRFCRIDLGEAGHRFVWTFHHALLDGWSLPILLRELFALYRGAVMGAEAELEPAPPYRDYIAWLLRQDWSAAEAFWRRELSGFTAATSLGMERTSAAAGKGAEPRQQRRDAVLPAATADRLRAYCREQRITLNTLFQGAWALLLHRYGSDEDVVFGAVNSGRSAPLAGIERMIGLFINTLPARVRIAPWAALPDWLATLQEQQVLARQFEHTPLQEVQGWSEVPRDLPLFESILVFENYPVDGTAPQPAGARPDIGAADFREQTNYPLCLSVMAQPQLHLRLLHDRDRCSGARAVRLLGHLETLLEQIPAHANRPAGELSLLTAAERHQLSVEWTDTRRPLPEDGLCLHQLFEAWVERAPDATAIIAHAGVITYRGLNRRANRLARRLRRLGVGAEVRVGVLVERSPEVIVGLLAILKAGGCYVPLDPAYPAERRELILRDAGIQLLLGEEGSPAAPAIPGLCVLPFDDGAPPAAESDDDLALPLDPEAAAYVIYTSGSTGRPNGVLVKHRGVVNLLTVFGPPANTRPGSRMAYSSSVGFDASLLEILLALSAGATLVVPRDEECGVPALLAQSLVRHEVTVTFRVPSLLSLLPEGELSSLTTIMMGGEAATRELAARWAPGRSLINVYGPTEASILTTREVCTEETLAGRVAPSLGRPFHNTCVYVLAADLQALPIGAVGELAIGGMGLARGYLERPDKTAERFIPHPFAQQIGAPGARLYRTGDLVRVEEDGRIDFLGRIDQQVKLHGVRIELGEVEAVLAEHPAVRQGIALICPDRQGEKRLAAFLVPRAGSEIDRGELWDFLRQRLPGSFVPAALIPTPALPLLPSGKVDRRALLQLLEVYDRELASGPGSLESLTQVEELVAGAFAQVLDLERVGAEDRFFDLGGDSLLAARLTVRLEEALGVGPPLSEIFATPTVSGLAAYLERALAAGESAGLPPLAPASRSGRLPLSFAQQRLWFLHRLHPDSAAYNIATAVRLEGPLEVAVLSAALGEIVRRHEVLRTTFPTDAGEPFQAISLPRPFAVPVIDVRGLPAAERWPTARRLARAEAHLPFDLSRGPLWRFTLVAVAEQEHAALLTLHHAISDGWSMGVLVRELGVLYTAFAQAQPSPLPELRSQYADFAIWQRSWLSEEVLAREIDLWRQRLAGVPEVLNLPVDRPRPRVQAFRGRSRSAGFPPGMLARLQKLARREDATLFMTLLAGLEALLHRYTGEPRIAVGTPTAGRRHVEVEPLLGCFVNTLVLAPDLSGDPPFKELMARAKEATLWAYAHQDLPFEKLVEGLQPERSASYSPLIQVMLALQGSPLPAPALTGLALSPLNPPSEAAKLDLALDLTAESGGVLRGAWSYDRDLFEATTIERLAGHLQNLLSGAVADSGLRLSELPLLSATERQQMLEWSSMPASSSGEFPFHHLSAAQAARTPDAVAIEFQGETLSYRELDAAANRLAHRLRRLGVGPEVIVGLCLERSLDLVIAVLGILKAGGAYLPLDPGYPEARLELMLHDSGAAALVTRESLLARLPGLGRVAAGLPTLRLDRDRGAIAKESAVSPNVAVSPENLAYVIYTSGSTGRPKGVMVPHRGLANMSAVQVELFDVGGEDRVLQFAALSFDGAVWEMVMALRTGAALVLAPRMKLLPGPELLELMGRARISVLSLPPSALATLPAGSAEQLSGLQVLVVAGEAFPLETAGLWWSGRRLFNGYGPTEASVCATLWLYRGEGRLPIGRPVANVGAHVLDRQGVPVPQGVPGELYLSGAGLARGYVGQPERTAERFVPHLLARRAGERLYRTGDLVRWLADGALEFLGRVDQQVKVRGFRLELGEIESALTRLPGLREAAVVAVGAPAGSGTGSGAMRLVAFLVADPGVGRLAGTEVRQLLSRTLPDFMIPADLVPVDALPLLPNGKVDRQALGHLAAGRGGARPEQDQDFVAPETPVDQALAALWREVLAVEQVGIHDDFFALGGHSLTGAVVINRLQDLLGEAIPMGVIFDAPTVAGLAADLAARYPEQVRRIWGPESLARRPDLADAVGETAAPGGPSAVGQQRSLVAIERAPQSGPLPLSFAQERLWFLDQLLPGSAAYNMPVALRLRGSFAVPPLRTALTEVVRRHEILRTTFPLDGGEPVQRISASRPVPLPLIDLTGLAAADRQGSVRRLLRQEMLQPFDLARGPLLRARLVRLGVEEHALLLSLHHIVSDGWSMRVLARELGTLYTAFSEGLPSPLPELDIQYADFALWQRQWLSGSRLATELPYWREQLAGAVPLELPTDRPRPALPTDRGGSRSLALADGLVPALQALSRRGRATTFMTLLAGFATLLARYAGQDDLTVGTPVAGRNLRQTEDLIGLFINTLVLRADLSGDPGFDTVLTRVRRTTVDAFARQEFPFEKLVAELQPERDTSRTPLFQALFTLEQATAAPDLARLQLSPLGVEDQLAKFDLSLSVVEQRERLACSLSYRTDLFDATTIDRMLNHLRALLAAAAGTPRRGWRDLPMLSAAELHAVLAEWNDTAAGSGSQASVQTQVAERAGQTPDRIAVVSADQHLSYAELASRADRLARALRRLGVGAETRVGIHLERSLDIPIALLGVLCAGGTYVPLDPAFPVERLQLMAEDAGVEVVLTAEHLRGALGALPVRELALEQGRAACGAESSLPLSPLPPLPTVTGPDHLAYILYTSGSTGRPKGVQIAHRALANFLASMQQEPGLSSADVLVSVTSLSFDIAGLELYLPLLAGARVVLASRDQAGSGAALEELLETATATVLQATPTTWRLLVEAGWSGRPGLKALSGGEALPAALGAELLTRAASVWNLYGPTETTIWSTVGRVGRAEPITAGRPIARTEIRILDAAGHAVPAGVRGELLIGGAGLARGYWGRPDLTAERFIPDPFEPLPGARLYRTGDLARWWADGRLEYLGRMDQQVKVRGFRIEPGEIDAVLGQHPGIAEVVTLAKEDPRGESRLVAFLVPRSEPVDREELAGLLRARLPQYMMPAALVFVERLPLLPNGKVDRKALRNMEVASGDGRREGAYAAPRTLTELQLVRIWEDLLGVQPVGIRDNFFDLGGHSVASVRLMARIKNELGRELPLATLFMGPTIEAIARRVQREGEDLDGSPLVPIQPRGDRRPFFCVHPIGGGVLGFRHLAGHLPDDRPFYGLQAPGLDRQAETPSATIEEMAACYLAAVRTVQPCGPYLLGGSSFGGVVAFEMAQQLVRGGEEVALLALFDTAAPGRSWREPDDAVLIAGLARAQAGEQGQTLALSADDLRGLPYEEQIAKALAAMRDSGIVGPEIDVAWLVRFLTGYRSRLRAWAMYRPAPCPARITLFRAAVMDAEDLRQLSPEERQEIQDPSHGWEPLATGGIDLQWVPGDHGTMIMEPHARDLARALEACMAQAEAGVRSAQPGAPGQEV
jgi:amino acid adenylation domain-containing protein/non-ribosomal peptide synthase protein (TIGR01720 family)